MEVVSCVIKSGKWVDFEAQWFSVFEKLQIKWIIKMKGNFVEIQLPWVALVDFNVLIEGTFYDHTAI